jgi:hypothetical protein
MGHQLRLSWYHLSCLVLLFVTDASSFCRVLSFASGFRMQVDRPDALKLTLS